MSKIQAIIYFLMVMVKTSLEFFLMQDRCPCTRSFTLVRYTPLVLEDQDMTVSSNICEVQPLQFWKDSY